jgi:AraC-like DNA-binding protein
VIQLNLYELTQGQPIVPYIRESEYAVRPAYYFPFRKLLDYLLIYIRKGRLRVVADGAEHLFEEGEFCLLQPGTTHDLRGLDDNETPFMHMDIFYHPERERSFPTKPGQLDLTAYSHLMQPRLNHLDGLDIPVKLRPNSPHLYADLLLKMIEGWLAPDSIRKLEVQALGTQLVYAIIRDHAKKTIEASPNQHQLDWVDSYLSFHLAESISIDAMAKRAHLSPSRFRDVFRGRFGMPPHQYLISLRLQHAKELLTTTSNTMAAIAEYCGFSDVFHFAKTFKQHTGDTPGAYRNLRS